MRILFLDFDGVLNNAKGRNLFGIDHIDSRLVDILATIVKQTDVHIVISSDWRKYHTIDQLKAFIDNDIVNDSIIGVTDDNRIWSDDYSFIQDILPRGQVIKNYVDSHDVSSYVILDDNPVDYGQNKYLVRTSDKFGLQQKHIKSVKRILDNG